VSHHARVWIKSNPTRSQINSHIINTTVIVKWTHLSGEIWSTEWAGWHWAAASRELWRRSAWKRIQTRRSLALPFSNQNTKWICRTKKVYLDLEKRLDVILSKQNANERPRTEESNRTAYVFTWTRKLKLIVLVNYIHRTLVGRWRLCAALPDKSPVWRHPDVIWGLCV